jgi:hypothetical protein
MFEMFDIFDIFVENPEDYQHIIRFPGVDIFDIFENLRTAQELWGIWEVMSSCKHGTDDSARRLLRGRRIANRFRSAGWRGDAISSRGREGVFALMCSRDSAFPIQAVGRAG